MDWLIFGALYPKGTAHKYYYNISMNYSISFQIFAMDALTNQLHYYSSIYDCNASTTASKCMPWEAFTKMLSPSFKSPHIRSNISSLVSK